MYRVLFFLGILILPVVFGWWLFFPLALLYVYLAKLPYEIIFVAVILDSLYHFGSSLFSNQIFLIFSLLLLLVAFFLSRHIYWRKVI